MSETVAVAPVQIDQAIGLTPKKRTRRTKAQLIAAGVLNPDGTRPPKVKGKPGRKPKIKEAVVDDPAQMDFLTPNNGAPVLPASELSPEKVMAAYELVFEHIIQNMDVVNVQYFNMEARGTGKSVKHCLASNLLSAYGLKAKVAVSAILKDNTPSTTTTPSVT